MLLFFTTTMVDLGPTTPDQKTKRTTLRKSTTMAAVSFRKAVCSLFQTRVSPNINEHFRINLGFRETAHLPLP